MKVLSLAAALVALAVPASAQPPMPSSPFSCTAVSDDGFVNVREWPNGPIMGPVPVGTQFQVINTWYDLPTGMNWSRVQTPWLAQRGISGVVASYLIDCDGYE
jgi:hypothetical protein